MKQSGGEGGGEWNRQRKMGEREEESGVDVELERGRAMRRVEYIYKLLLKTLAGIL